VAKQLPNPRESAEKWAGNLSAATEAIRKGVARVTKSPPQAAAEQADLWQTKVSSAEAKEKFKANAGAVSNQEWQNKMTTVGLPRIASGAQAGKGKQEQHLARFFPYLQQGMDALPPRGTLEQNLQRSNQMARHNAGYRKNG